MVDLILSNRSLKEVQTALLSGMEVAGVASSKATHYHKASDQRAAVAEAVQKLYAVSKELPLIVAAQKGAQGFFIQEALLNEFQMTTMSGTNNVVNPKDWDDDLIRDLAVQACLHNLDENAGIPYVLRMATEFKKRKVNNARSRRFILAYLWDHQNLEFVAVKYRAKLRAIFTHIYGRRMSRALVAIARKLIDTPSVLTTKERDIFEENIVRYSDRNDVEVLAGVLLYVYGEGLETDYSATKFRVISQVFAARRDVFSATLVPEEVLVGLVSDKSHPQHDELWSTKEKQAETVKAIRSIGKVETANQAVRKTKQEQRKGIERTVEEREKIVAAVDDPIALLKTVYEGGKLWQDVEPRVLELAQKYKPNLPYRKIGVVVDMSTSMHGDYQQSKNTPLAHAFFGELVLETIPDTASQLCMDGHLARSFLELHKYTGEDRDAVFILSDGYENCYDGLLDEVIAAWRNLTGSTIPIFHVSPIGSAETNARARTLGANLVSLSATYKNLGMAVQANLLAADTKLWLKNAVEALLQ